MKKFILFILLSCFLFSGCQTLSDRIPLETKSKAEKAIAALQASHKVEMDAKMAEIAAQMQTIIAAQKGQMQGGADSFYAQNLLFNTIPSPVRTDLIWHNYSMEGWQALGNLTPTYAKMTEINERLKKELDATQTSLADLQKTHEVALAANQKLVDSTKTALDKLAALEAQRATLETDYRAKMDKLQGDLNDANNKVIALEKARADDAAAIQALKTKVSMICGGIVLICTVAAIYLPVGRGVAIVIGLIAAAGGSLIWIITGPQVLMGCGVGILGAVGYLLYKHNISDRGNKAFANLLHEKPELVAAADEWTTKYVKAPDGTITTVPDTAVQALVKSKLIASDKA